MISRVVRNGIDRKVIGRAMLFDLARARLLNLQRGRRAFTVGERHYDIGNDLYERMLDSRMIYSCGYWKEARTLDEAQEAKLDLTARKLGLEPGMRVLDIGCGWGGTARFLAERYGCDVVGVTVSREQVAYAREHGGGPAPPTAAAPAGSVEIRLQDYRDISEEFDRVVSIGMFEHVGVKNYPTFMDVVRRVLRRDGLCLLHTIGSNRSVSGNDPWLDRYIFPNSMLPSIKQIAQAAEGRFVVEDWHNFGVYYDTTLLHWDENFRAAWPELAERYGERFYRMWRYFLLSSAGGFRARKNQLWQVVLSPEGVPGGYRSVR
jgi:cyclopropane-fatty-acyl-phospholipid synthase